MTDYEIDRHRSNIRLLRHLADDIADPFAAGMLLICAQDYAVAIGDDAWPSRPRLVSAAEDQADA